MMTSVDRLALLGGPRLRHQGVPAWPQPSYTAHQALQAVLDSGHWWQSGNGFAEKLENWLADQFHAPAPVAVASGTLALELALAALDIGPGDEVLVPAITFIATATAVSRIGATPVPVDITPATLLVDLDQASDAVTSRTAALIVVHLAGSAVDLAAARTWCDSRGLALVEDSAQAVTAAVNDQRVATVGDAAILSFQAAKQGGRGQRGPIEQHLRVEQFSGTVGSDLGQVHGEPAPDDPIPGPDRAARHDVQHGGNGSQRLRDHLRRRITPTGN